MVEIGIGEVSSGSKTLILDLALLDKVLKFFLFFIALFLCLLASQKFLVMKPKLVGIYDYELVLDQTGEGLRDAYSNKRLSIVAAIQAIKRREEVLSSMMKTQGYTLMLDNRFVMFNDKSSYEIIDVTDELSRELIRTQLVLEGS